MVWIHCSINCDVCGKAASASMEFNASPTSKQPWQLKVPKGWINDLGLLFCGAECRQKH